jgi:hypothetical protein
VGEGSRFIFTLPCGEKTPVPEKDAGTDAAEEAPVPTADAPRHAGTILIADDEPVNLRVLESQLTARGYRVVKAYSGAEALSLIPPTDSTWSSSTSCSRNYPATKCAGRSDPSTRWPSCLS